MGLQVCFWRELKSCVLSFQLSRKQLYEKFKSQWFEFGENKKLKYIKLAIEAKEKYDVSVIVFSSLTSPNPNLSCLDLWTPNIHVCGLDLSVPNLKGLNLSVPNLFSLDFSILNLYGQDFCIRKIFGLDLSNPNLSGLDLLQTYIA